MNAWKYSYVARTTAWLTSVTAAMSVRSMPSRYPGRRIPSLNARRRAESSSGRPINVRNTCVGSGTANSTSNVHSPRSWKPSIRSLTCLVIAGCMSLIVRGANIGSSSLRYRWCSGGSFSIGISGRCAPPIGPNFDE